MILVVGGIKGGSGKTTLATNLAVFLSRIAMHVLLVDADDQCSCADWADQREQSQESHHGLIEGTNIVTISLSGNSIHKQLAKLRSNYTHIIVDTGGRDTVSQRSALSIANGYLLPFKPRSLDIWTIGKVQDLINEIWIINPDMVVMSCINQADPNGTDNQDALKVLADCPQWHCLEQTIGHRKAFSNAAAQGLGVCELPKVDAKACEEIALLHREIYTKHIRNI